jgi:tRNA threonylcarbamoyladenosine modification (KEOPS) complex  Pcc1 subunit
MSDLTYSLSSYISKSSTSFDDVNVLTASDLSADGLAWSGSATQVNVTNYGATGDGSTNDTTAIVNAISATPSGATLYFPPGTYIVSSTITVPGNIRLLGSYLGQSTIKLTSGFSSVDPMFTSSFDGVPGTYLSSNIRFENLVFDGNNNSSRNGAGYLLRPIQVNTLKIIKCGFINNTFMAIALAGNSGVDIWGSKFANCGIVPPTTQSSPALFVGGTSNYAGANTNVNINKCVFRNNKWSGIYFFPTGGSVKNSLFVNNGESSIFSNNTLANATIENNYFYGATRTNISASGLELGGSNLTIRNNFFRNSGSDGLSLTNVKTVLVEDNTSYDNGQELSYPSFANAGGFGVTTINDPDYKGTSEFSENITFRYNRGYNSTGSSPQVYGLYFYKNLNLQVETSTFNNNNFYNNSTSGIGNLNNGYNPSTVTFTGNISSSSDATAGASVVSIVDNFVGSIPASNDATLSSLTISNGTLSPAFRSTTTSYTDFVANDVSSVTVTPTLNESNAAITVNGNSVTSGSASSAISLSVGSNIIRVIVTAQDGFTTKTYTVTITKAAVLPALKYYNYIVKPNCQTISIPGAGDKVITFWDYPNNRVVVSDEGYWNPDSPIGAKLAIAVQWAHNQGLQAGVVVNAYSSNRFGDGVNTTAGGMGRSMPGATDQQLYDYIDAADFVVTDPYGVTPATCTTEVLNNFASFVTNLGNYANSKGKPTWLILQGFGPKDVDPNIIEAYNDRLVTENVHRFTDLSFFNKSDFRDDEDPTPFIQLNTQRAVNTLANITGIYPTYTITPAAASVNEGESLTFTVATTDVTNETPLNWALTNAGDFATSTGNVTINSNSGTFSVTPTADLTTEGAETFTASIYTGSTNGTPVATSSPATIINDRSTTPVILSSDATLSALTVSNVTLSFSPDTTSYTASVLNGVSSVTVTPTRNESNASIAITFNGTSVTSGSTNTLNVGSNIIRVVVTAQDGTTKTYTVTITRAAVVSSNDATLSALTISNVTLSPTFNSATTSYTASVLNGVGSVTVTPTRNESNAAITFTVNDISVTSGTISLSVGSNIIKVIVTAQDGTTKTYTVTITRASALASYVSFVGVTDTLPDWYIYEGPYTATFTLTTTNVPNGTTLYWTTLGFPGYGTITADDFTDNTLQGTVTVQNNRAVITRSARADLTTEGAELFQLEIHETSYDSPVVITSSSSSASGAFGIGDTSTTPTTPTLSSDATLSALTISNVTLSPTFNSATTSYTASVANSIGSVTVTPTRNESNASIAITFNGTSVTSGSTNTLNVGSNTITIVVTAQDGTTKTYTITITRAQPTLSSDATLSSLTISSGTLSPTFNSATTSYTASVANGISSVTVTPTRNESNAAITFTVNDISVTSSSINLNVGSNIIKVIVTAQDGTTKTYTITVTRESALALYVSFVGVTDTLPDWYIYEGLYTATFTLTTTNVPNGTTLYWTTLGNPNYGTITADDFTDNTLQGTVTVQNNRAVITRSARADLTTEGSELFQLEIHETSYDSPVVITSSSSSASGVIGIVDTSTTPTLSSDATLSALTISTGTLNPLFSSTTTSYTDFVANEVSSVTVTPTRNESHATITVNGNSVTSGSASGTINLNTGSNTITVIVTAQDGATKTYTIAVTRAAPTLSSDATLSSLIISSGTLSPAFSSTTTSYVNSVENGTSSITVTPTRNESHATITVNGNSVTSGSASGTINLNTGSNTITIVVTAQDNSTKTYTIIVSRASPSASNDATLSSLIISSGTLSPAFSSNTVLYTDFVANGVSLVSVTPTRNESHATITVNGNPVTSGSASGAINLNVGSNTITVIVTAQDGITTKTYTIVVGRASPTLSSDATLSSLIISSGTLSPAFSSSTISYTDSVANGTSSVTVTPTRNESHATITVNGSSVTSGSASGTINLNTGSNTITVIVTAQDNSTKTYTITVIRAVEGVISTYTITPVSTSINEGNALTFNVTTTDVPVDTELFWTVTYPVAAIALSNDATLSALTISSGTLNPSFSSGTISYIDFVANGVSSVTVTPTRNESHATITVNGSSVTSGSPSSSINLNVGSNTITIVVTAQDNSTKTYTIIVSRASPTLSSDATLSALTISSGILTPSFSSGTISYVDSVANEVSSVTVTPTRNESHATITVNGNSVTSGSASGAINLNVGLNTITIIVTSQDNGTKTYTIIVSRAAPAVSSDATLSSLIISSGALSPAFSSTTTSYVDSVANGTSSVTVTPTRNDSNATITVNGNSVTSGLASGAINLNVGSNTITIIVTAQDNSTKTYTIIVSRASPSASNDATLSSLTISSGTLTPSFSSGTISYIDSVENGTSSITVTPTRNESHATITVNGNSVTSGSASGSINLNVGSNTITIVVTAQDNSTKTYTIIVNRALPGVSNNATLSALTISSGILTPSFSSGTIAYTDSVANGTSSITVTPTRTESHATITVNGNSVTSGSASGSINLNVGSNTITIVVTAQDGTTKTYTITITRASPTTPTLSSDATLSSLTISSGILSPSFSSATTSYTALVANGVSSVTVTPTRSQSNATITVNGNSVTSGLSSSSINLNVGSNTITIVVTAQDGTTKTYTIVVTRALVVLSNDATLSSLTISSGTLSPSFSSATTSYTATVLNGVSSVTVTPTRNESNATITVNGNSVTSGSASGSINLNVGSNTITIVVTAQDGTTKTYTIVVTRPISSDATLSALTISNVTLSPTFNSTTTSYTASVANSIGSVTVTPTANESHASIAITVNDTPVNSSTISLSVGANAIVVIVTAQDGTTKTYTIVVTRPISSDATLSALTFSSGPSNFLFNSGTTSYTDAVANRFDSVTVTPIANESNATIKVNNTTVTSGTASNLINLNVGPNTITIVVTAQDRQTIKTYTIVLTRLTPPLSNNATLSSLTISRGLLIPSFNPNTLSYKDFVMNGVSSVTVTPTRNEPHATITVNGSSVTSGTASDLINLTVGSNTITVIVTAQDGLTMQVYAIKVIREIGSDEWVNGSYLGSISTGVISDLAVLAREIKSDYTIKYQLISGALPNGLTLARDGTIVGSAEYGTAGDYLFTVLASDIYEFGSIARTFSLTVIEVTDTKYTSIYVRPFLPQEKRKEYQDFIGNSFTFDPSLIYRYFDPNFGVQHDIKMVIDFGIEQLNLDQYAIALRQNFYRRTFYFGDVKTAIASDSTGNIIYEVVYVDIIDNIQGAAEIFNNNGRDYYPASIDNMRKQLNSIQLPDYSTIKVNRDLLPKFMDTQQPGEYQVPNYMHIVPLCYALPGQGSRIVSRIKLSGFNFKQLSFEVDRLVVQNSLDSSSAKYLLLERQSLSDAIKSDNVLYEGTFDWQFDDNVVLTRN